MGTALQKSLHAWKDQPELKKLLLLTAIFFGFMLVFSLNRYYTFYASYDQGIFNQVFWNSLHGRFFQSSLTSGISIGVTEDGKIPTVSFLHLAHHFVPNFLLWLPLYALFPGSATLIVLQVVLMTAGGGVLYVLARHYLQPGLSLMITASYFGAIAVIGPTFANFYEHSQIPLFTFGLLLAMEKRRWGVFWLLTVLVLGIREDAGFMLFSIGLYLLFSRRYPRVGLILCLLSFTYVTVVTNLVIPRFSDSNDVSRMHLANRFRQFVQGNPDPSTLQVLWGMLTHPIEVIKSLFTPLDRRLFYLFRQWLPLAFVPALSPSAWVLAGVPLLSLFLQSGKSALSITIRYSLVVVPGLFYGAILWWSVYANRFKPRFRRFWAGCIALSIVFAVTANPNRAFSFLIPDSFVPWVYVPLTTQWQHAGTLRQQISLIPPDASVSATTHLIPQLSGRRAILRLPMMQIRDDQGKVVEMDYLIADLWQLERYQVAFSFERQRLEEIVLLVDTLLKQNRYGILGFKEGVIVMQKGVPSNPMLRAEWNRLRQGIGG
ncbi:DUF2079 domain-containing protein [Kovacikia minuta CCNUW1]|uniref:DUF2079 domain-containing protein n=1 Tax=Kovacikia minuta TaxID=2931930 RepID=UPI001CCE59AA|nr:DUF2079 domain-containing protein [Kovacikia minuta]UBF23952.1 DUF2079 domain-containing protein [Kovacikia minuta CCNUW1]